MWTITSDTVHLLCSSIVLQKKLSNYCQSYWWSVCAALWDDPPPPNFALAVRKHLPTHCVHSHTFCLLQESLSCICSTFYFLWLHSIWHRFSCHTVHLFCMFLHMFSCVTYLLNQTWFKKPQMSHLSSQQTAATFRSSAGVQSVKASSGVKPPPHLPDVGLRGGLVCNFPKLSVNIHAHLMLRLVSSVFYLCMWIAQSDTMNENIHRSLHFDTNSPLQQKKTWFIRRVRSHRAAPGLIYLRKEHEQNNWNDNRTKTEAYRGSPQVWVGKSNKNQLNIVLNTKDYFESLKVIILWHDSESKSSRLN